MKQLTEPNKWAVLIAGPHWVERTYTFSTKREALKLLKDRRKRFGGTVVLYKREEVEK